MALAFLLTIPTGCSTTAQDAAKVHDLMRHVQPWHHYSTYYVPNDAMLPTIHGNTDQLLVDESAYDSVAPQRGDIIVFMPPLSSGDVYVKRVIAVPGDKLAIRNGSIQVNGRPLAKALTRRHPNYSFSVASFHLVSDGVPLDTAAADVPPQSYWVSSDRLPRGCYFVVGDNVNQSLDSHVWGCAELRGSFSSGPRRGKSTQLVGKVVSIVARLRPSR
jgi:signal peptidase I